MTPPDDSSLSLTEVRERFDSSAQLLDEVQAQLRRIVDGEGRRTEIRDELAASASSVEQFAKEAADAAATLSAAQRSATAAFSSLSSIADGTELRAIREEVAALRESQQTMVEQQKTLESQVAEGLARLSLAHEDIVSRVEDAKGLRDELTSVTKQLESLRAAAGARAIKKAGLE